MAFLRFVRVITSGGLKRIRFIVSASFTNSFIDSISSIYSLNLKSIAQFHTDPSVQHIGSTQGPHLFSTQNPSVPHTPHLNTVSV